VKFFPDDKFKIQSILLLAICVCVLGGILVAGLWPFRAPKNEVSWLPEGNGILFGKHGSIVSANPIQASGSRAEKSCSLEIWLQPRRLDSAGTILSFYSPISETASFSLGQWRGGLVLEGASREKSSRGSRVYVPDVFRGLKPVMVTMSFAETGATIYADANLLKRVPNFILAGRDLTGQLVVGSNSSATFNWSGQLKGIAIYDHDLTVPQVSQSYSDWMIGRPPTSVGNDGAVDRYLFNEGQGSIVHNQVDSGTSLLVPERFFAVHKIFLERPWDEYQNGWHYWKDVAVNVAGFVPLGFFFCAYFGAVLKIRHATWLTVFLGFAVSLTIEVSQAFLPTRDSGITDIITNTCGTSLGTMVWYYLMCLRSIHGYDWPFWSDGND